METYLKQKSNIPCTLCIIHDRTVNATHINTKPVPRKTGTYFHYTTNEVLTNIVMGINSTSLKT
jgi:hypothetical protein